jgi:3-carboxy-cis,cis-muconate cycloisomerase
MLLDARTRLAQLELPAQLGGAAGTLAPLGEHGTDVLGLFAAELGLREPLLPWHADRAPVAALAAARDAASRAAAKFGLDVVLLAQTEIGEVSELEGGGSSTMPQKRNPVRAMLARACARGVHAQASLLTGGEHEHERAAGAWQAEWGALSGALALTGGAVAAIRECLEGLQVHAERMRANMSDGLLAERVAFEGPDADTDPVTYLGSADAFVERALERYRELARRLRAGSTARPARRSSSSRAGSGRRRPCGRHSCPASPSVSACSVTTSRVTAPRRCRRGRCRSPGSDARSSACSTVSTRHARRSAGSPSAG